jgi:uncharacterized membrane protein YdbT with pleckstrin-like domain
MYRIFRDWCERLLRIPHDPAPPPGDEASARVFRAAPAYLKYRTVLWAIGAAVSLIFGIVFLGGSNVALALDSHAPAFLRVIIFAITSFVFVMIVLHALFSFAVIRLDYEKRWYIVTDRSLRIREGVLNVREMTVMFANIQNVSVMQGPIQRPLGIADLQVETAGGGSARANEKQLGPNLHVAWFRGIDNAEEVRLLIQERLRALKDSGLGHHEEMRAAPASTPAFLDALRAVHTEARALREAAAR